MGRSVGGHPYSVATAYATLEPETHDPETGEGYGWDHISDLMAYEYEWLKDDAIEQLGARWPSLQPAEGWHGREGVLLARNAHAEAYLYEYGGIVAFDSVPIDDNDHPGLSEAWCRRIAPAFEQLLGTVRRLGVFSNGEAVYERVA